MNDDKRTGSNGKKAFSDSFYRVLRSFGAAFPMVLGVILLNLRTFSRIRHDRADFGSIHRRDVSRYGDRAAKAGF
jgi:hypothetical protein